MKICDGKGKDDPVIGNVYRYTGEYHLHGEPLYLACVVKDKWYLVSLTTGFVWSKDGGWGCQGRKPFVDVTYEYCLTKVL